MRQTLNINHLVPIGLLFVAALSANAGETLPNGIVLPDAWPPKVDVANKAPVRAPYLDPANIPNPIRIDTGRQLFVDDFLVESKEGVVRAFRKPLKHPANPVFWPQTPVELAQDTGIGADGLPKPGAKMAHSPGCVMPGGGVWWDPSRKCFRMWYMPGWWGRISYAESKDGLHWTRPPVGPKGDNVLMPDLFSDTFSVSPDWTAKNPYSQWCLFSSPGGGKGMQYVSPDGIVWKPLCPTGQNADSNTLYYDPFAGNWVWSLRHSWRSRSRAYRAHPDFRVGAEWDFDRNKSTADCHAWLACDSADLPCEVGGSVRRNAQLYNMDAAPYESLMVGLFKILCGRDNDEAARGGLPKSTSIHFAYSRDGFHFDRPDRTPAILESDWGSGEWDTGYLSACSSGFVIKDDRLWFFYTGLRGDACANKGGCSAVNGMHWNGAIGVATLRRDGFAGLVADGRGTVVTRPVVFSGSHFFVNADARFGKVTVEVLDDAGAPVPGYSAADCRAIVREDSTKHAITWKGGNLARFAGKPVRFRFVQRVATLYAFWVSKESTGESGGYVAAGGPAFRGLKDE